MQIKGIIAYFEYLEATGNLSDAEFGRLWRGAMNYGLSNESPTLCGNEKFAFGFMKNQIDRDKITYDKRCETSKENGKLGGRKPKENLTEPKKANKKENEIENIKEILSKESTKKVRGTLTFKAPSLNDVENYCLERENLVSPEAFINFYESNGWHVGKNKMKDWKAAVRTWEMRDSNYQNQKKGEPNYGANENEVGRRAQCTEFLDVESTDGSKLSPEEIARIRAENEEFAKIWA